MEADVTRNIEEQLSAFLDGELPEAELQMLIRRLEKDENYRATLARFTLIGSAIRNDPAFAEIDSVRSGVMSLLTADDAVEDQDPASETKHESTSTSSGSNRRTGSLLAAAVATLAVIGIYQVDQGGLTDDPVSEPAIAEVAQAEPVRAVVRTVPDLQGRPGRINADRITSYMVSHGEFSRSFQGTMVDSRVFVQPASYQE